MPELIVVAPLFQLCEQEKAWFVTSHHFITVDLSVHQVKSLLGESEYEYASSDGKCQFNWTLETVDGGIVTLYDYKEGATHRQLSKRAYVRWHVGSNDNTAVLDMQFVEWLQDQVQKAGV